MADILSKLQAPVGAVTRKTRVGRGTGSGLGKTCGRGQKGQKARNTGAFSKIAFVGGQTTFQRRLPKRGFVNLFRAEVAIVNVGDLERFSAGSTIDEATLRDARLVQGRCDRIKILGEGELTKALTVNADSFSKSAVEKIEKAGGKVVAVKPSENTEKPEASAE